MAGHDREVRGPRLHAGEVDVDDVLVRGLVDRQFPEWADLPLERSRSTGTQNAIYRLGDVLAVRVPRIGQTAQQVGREHDWLPVLARHLPVKLPDPVAVGEPDLGYPFRWLVYRWIEGEDAGVGEVGDWDDLARDVAEFVQELQLVDAEGAPSARKRGRGLEPHNEAVRVAIQAMGAAVDVDRALAVWDEALHADTWAGPPVWVHGDLLPGNLLVRDGRLVGVIDWSATGVGDPACDTMLAWTMPSEARAVYRETLGLDDATWARGRGWTIEQAVRFIPYYAATIPSEVEAARQRLEAVLSESR